MYGTHPCGVRGSVRAAKWVVAMLLASGGCEAIADEGEGIDPRIGVLPDGLWRQVETQGVGPSQRSVPAVAALGRSVYVFGGSDDDVVDGSVTILDDLFRFDTLRRRWTELEPEGAVPPARAFAGSVAHRPSNRMLVFGGAVFGDFFSDFVGLDDFWAYDVEDNAWTELIPTNDGPEGRSGPSMWIEGDRIYVFGGITSFFQVLNDLWVYDLGTNTWTELIANGEPGSPPPRDSAQSGTQPVSDRLIIYGGESLNENFEFITLNDTWEFDLEDETWTELTPEAPLNIDPPRNLGASTLVGRNLYLHGGDVPGGEDCGAVFLQNPTEELWRFDLDAQEWSQLQPIGDPLARLKRTSAATVGGSMYIFGGFDFECNDGVPEQIWNLDVYRFLPLTF